MQPNANVISMRWVDISKGDREKPEYPSKLVAQGANTGKRDDLCAATPPLEAKQMLIPIVMSDMGQNEG